MGIELKLHPQTALLMLIDALMSAGVNYKLELYVEAAGVGGVIWLLNDDQQSGQFLFADSDLAKLLSKFMQYAQQPSAASTSEPAVEGELEPPTVYQESAAVASQADATGVPE